MNRISLITTILVLLAIPFCVSCDKEDVDFDNLRSPIIEGLTVGNYPKVDGSTSAEPLNAVIFCKLFGIGYKWAPEYWNLQRIEPNLNKRDSEKFWNMIKSSTTHQSYINLIDKEADFILNARSMSSDEKAYAEDKGVNLIENPIASDALIFIVNPNNPITSLTSGQIQDIYTGKITNWKEVGGNDIEIRPYVRDANSGSQELMEALVMKDFDITQFPVNNHELIVFNMTGAFDVVFHEANAICYTLYYYKENIATGYNVKSVTIDGVYPDKATISNKSYPYVAPVYAVVRSDLDKLSMAYKLYEWIQTEGGTQAISESGYVPY